MKKWATRVTLENDLIRLEPMEAQHKAGLIESVSDGNLWELWYTSVPSPPEMDAFIENAVSARKSGDAIVFVVRLRSTDEIVGSTRYMNIDHINRRLEIGYTWYAGRHQRTAVNTNCKLLLLTHAFEALEAIAVEFRTHSMNQRSRAAIERLGARQDGVLRNHMQLPDGTFRDTAVFSIINSEWPAVRRNLQPAAIQSKRGSQERSDP